MQSVLLRTTLFLACWHLADVTPVGAQLPFEPALTRPADLPSWIRRGVKAQAPKYRMIGGNVFGTDSILIAFEDSTLTATGLENGTWSFGPKPTKAESEQCPPEKVLGRKIARAVWREAGKPASWKKVSIRVQGTRETMDKHVALTMFYYHSELTAPWVGDKN